MKISQTTYIDAIVKRAGLENVNPMKMPINPNVKLMRFEGEPPAYPYATMIGSLMWTALGTCPDIAFAVQHLAQFTSCYGPEHITALKRIFHYLKGTADYRITYDGRGASLETYAYADADWGQNVMDRKSISGYVFFLAGAAVAWSSKKQPTVTLSMMEAEYSALT